MGEVVFGREGDPDLDLPRGSWKEESGTLTESWGVGGAWGGLFGGAVSSVGFGGKTHTLSYQKKKGRRRSYHNTHGVKGSAHRNAVSL